MPTRILELQYDSSSLNYFEQLPASQYAVLLSSSVPSCAGRYDILAANPATVIETHRDESAAATLARVRAAIEQYTSPVERADYLAIGLPFVSGAIGLLSYGAGEDLTDIEYRLDARWPATHAGIYQWAIVQDHTALRSWLVADDKLENSAWQALHDRFSAATLNTTPLTSLMPQHGQAQEQDAQARNLFGLTSNWTSSLDWHQYNEKFALLQGYIRSGDCYQVNLTREFTAQYSGEPWQAFKQLQLTAPAPFSGFLKRPNATVISCSPERFIALHDSRAITQPIKGTKPRGEDAAQDAKLISELSASEKDRAENLMIVDLMRNDFGKVCTTGTVSVPELFRIKSYSNVHHLLSTVGGHLPLQNPATALDLLTACMPGGSVTGAPKKRAMEIINELEPHCRSIYCGSLFYINRDGEMDSNILIRSLLFTDTEASSGSKSVYCWGGGGIVADSNCEEEFAESDYKIAHILKTLKAMNSEP